VRPDRNDPEHPAADGRGPGNGIRADRIEGPVVQAGTVHGDVNVHLRRRHRVVDEERRRERRELLRNGASGLGALLMIAAAITLPHTLPWAKSALTDVGPEDAPNVSTSHVGDCAAWNARSEPDRSGGPVHGGVAVLVKVPCWHRSALYRVTAIVPEAAVLDRVRAGKQSGEQAIKDLCRSEPGWGSGTYVRSTDTVFCLAHD